MDYSSSYESDAYIHSVWSTEEAAREHMRTATFLDVPWLTEADLIGVVLDDPTADTVTVKDPRAAS